MNLPKAIKYMNGNLNHWDISKKGTITIYPRNSSFDVLILRETPAGLTMEFQWIFITITKAHAHSKRMLAENVGCKLKWKGILREPRFTSFNKKGIVKENSVGDFLASSLNSDKDLLKVIQFIRPDKLEIFYKRKLNTDELSLGVEINPKLTLLSPIWITRLTKINIPYDIMSSREDFIIIYKILDSIAKKLTTLSE